MSTIHKIARATPTGKVGRPQLYTYPFASLKRGETFRIPASHIYRARMHRFRFYQANGGWLCPRVFAITRAGSRAYLVTRTR